MKNKSIVEHDNSTKLRLELSRKISNASERLRKSSYWLCGLEEGIEGFSGTLNDVCNQLSELRKKLKHAHRLDGKELREIDSALRALDEYSDGTNSTEGQLTVCGIIDDAAYLSDIQLWLAALIDR